MEADKRVVLPLNIAHQIIAKEMAMVNDFSFIEVTPDNYHPEFNGYKTKLSRLWSIFVTQK